MKALCAMTAVDVANVVLKRMEEIKLLTSYKNRLYVNHSGYEFAKKIILIILVLLSNVLI